MSDHVDLYRGSRLACTIAIRLRSAALRHTGDSHKKGAKIRELRTFMTGLVVGESPRWHDGRLWFCNWGAQEIVAADLEGRREVMARNSAPAGYSIDWLPEGRLLMTGYELLRLEPDESLGRHAAVSGLKKRGILTGGADGG